METVSGLLTTALAIVALATLAGLGLMRGTVTNLRENLGDARAEIADKDRRLTALEKSDKQHQSELEALRRVVTGEVHWVALGETLDHHHSEAKGHWERDEATLNEILTELRRGRT